MTPALTRLRPPPPASPGPGPAAQPAPAPAREAMNQHRRELKRQYLETPTRAGVYRHPQPGERPPAGRRQQRRAGRAQPASLRTQARRPCGCAAAADWAEHGEPGFVFEVVDGSSRATTLPSMRRRNWRPWSNCGARNCRARRRRATARRERSHERSHGHGHACRRAGAGPRHPARPCRPAPPCSTMNWDGDTASA